MKFPSVVFCACLILTPLEIVPAAGGEAEVGKDGSIAWKAGIDGVEVEWNPDGSIRQLSSKYITAVRFADRPGINTAQIIAEEKAKGNIVRFMQQNVASTRVVAEVQADVSKAVQQSNGGGNARIQQTDERTLIESLTQVTASFAAGTLRGVTVLEKGYDKNSQEAWVVVGISQKSTTAARKLDDMMQSPSVPTTTGTERPDPTAAQPSEVRRSKSW
jgi:hypothetical protein